MELIDTHCHLDLRVFSQQYKDLQDRARAAGVVQMILPGVVQAGWCRLLKVCSEETDLFAAPGLHPMYLSHHTPEHLEELTTVVQNNKVVALGEIGLDYYLKSIDKDAQQLLFEQQLRIAEKEHLPILLHVRKAHDQVLATLRKLRFPHGGIVHAFNGSFQQAMRYIDFGFGIAVGGTITYSRAKRIRKVAADLPLESLVLETDAPDIPPAAHHGEVNLPEYLPDILAGLTSVRRESIEQIADCTSLNSRRILGLPSHSARITGFF